jgi:hypothetical protein
MSCEHRRTYGMGEIEMDEIFDNLINEAIDEAIDETIKELEVSESHKEKPKRQMAKFYAVIVASDAQFEFVVVADDKRDLKAQIESLQKKYEDKGMSISINTIIKGHEVKFNETMAIEFL